VGNRTAAHLSTLHSYDAANRLLDDSNFTYTYDANGNLATKTGKTTGDLTRYTYDPENQLTRVEQLTVAGGATPVLNAHYRYDALGRRIGKEVTAGGSTTTTWFIYDNEDILLELDGNNNITARYTHGPGIDEPLIMEKAGASFFYHADGLGSITEITNQAGSVVQSYTYSSFGKTESQLDPTFIQPHTFTAREFDPETGLYHYRNRYYDPNAGRLLSEDRLHLSSVVGSPLKTVKNGIIPAGLLRNPGFQNRYNYVNQNPITRLDPFGLWYVDINISGGYWLGLTGGVMINDTGIYPYLGGGFVTPGVSGSITFSPSDPTTGWNVGLQGGYWGGGQVGYGFGQGGGFYWEGGFVTPGASLTTFYVFGPFKFRPDGPPPGPEDFCP
jgi:RHS repeat-associated protein